MSGTTPKPLDEEKGGEKERGRPVCTDEASLSFSLTIPLPPSLSLLSSVSSGRATFLQRQQQQQQQQLSLSEGDRERTKRRLNRGEDNDIVTPLACQSVVNYWGNKISEVNDGAVTFLLFDVPPTSPPIAAYGQGTDFAFDMTSRSGRNIL